MLSAGVGEEVRERLVLFLPWVGFLGEKVLCLPFSLHPHSLPWAEVAMSVQQLDHWVPVMDLSHTWLSPEGHSCPAGAILSEELECQIQLLFLQYLVIGYNVIPQKEELSWAVQSTDVQLPSQ